MQTPQRLSPKPGSSNNTNQALNNYSLHTTASFCMFCMISPAVNKTGDQAAKGQICKHSQAHNSCRCHRRGETRQRAARAGGSKGSSASRSGPQPRCRVLGRRPCLPGDFGAEGQVAHAEVRLVILCGPEHTGIFQH